MGTKKKFSNKNENEVTWLGAREEVPTGKETSIEMRAESYMKYNFERLPAGKVILLQDEEGLIWQIFCIGTHWNVLKNGKNFSDGTIPMPAEMSTPFTFSADTGENCFSTKKIVAILMIDHII